MFLQAPLSLTNGTTRSPVLTLVTLPIPLIPVTWVRSWVSFRISNANIGSFLTEQLVYLAKVPDATQTSVTGLKWFKIAEDGLDANGVWGVTRLFKAGGKATAVIPKCIPSGNYFLRAEIIGMPHCNVTDDTLSHLPQRCMPLGHTLALNSIWSAPRSTSLAEEALLQRPYLSQVLTREVTQVSKSTYVNS